MGSKSARKKEAWYLGKDYSQTKAAGLDNTPGYEKYLV